MRPLDSPGNKVKKPASCSAKQRAVSAGASATSMAMMVSKIPNGPVPGVLHAISIFKATTIVGSGVLAAVTCKP